MGEDVIDSYTIRRLETEDAEEFRRVRLEALERHPESFGTSVTEEAARSLAHFRERLADPDTRIYGVFSDRTLVGHAAFHVLVGEKQRHRGEIYSVYVREDARRRGLARRLLTAVITDAQDQVEQIELDVLTGSPGARALYASLGFEGVGVIPRARKVDGRLYDDEIMVLDMARWRRVHGSPA